MKRGWGSSEAYADVATREAEVARDIAEKEKKKAQSTLEQFLKEQRINLASQARKKIESAEKNIQAGFMEAAKEDLEAALRFDTSVAIRLEVSKLKDKIK